MNDTDRADAVRHIARAALVHAEGSRALARRRLDFRAQTLLVQAAGALESDAGRDIARASVTVVGRTLEAAASLQDVDEPGRHTAHLGATDA